MNNFCYECKWDCKGVPFHGCGYELKPKEYKITPVQAQAILQCLDEIADGSTLYSLGIAVIRDYIKVICPEEFKPSQEYCCRLFRQAVKDGSIKVDITVGDLSIWAFREGYVMTHCFNCGKKPKPPIKEES